MMVVLTKAPLIIAIFIYLSGVPAFAQSGDKVPRALLENMARSQYAVLCGSSEFTDCMGFDRTACQELAEAAIQQCLLPLPDEISTDELDNDAIEACPKQVFADAGFTEEQAGVCFDKAMAPE
ncbi:MAG: hypothetical protein AB8B97_26475 [Granulosicoccus sp.]